MNTSQSWFNKFQANEANILVEEQTESDLNDQSRIDADLFEKYRYKPKDLYCEQSSIQNVSQSVTLPIYPEIKIPSNDMIEELNMTDVGDVLSRNTALVGDNYTIREPMYNNFSITPVQSTSMVAQSSPNRSRLDYSMMNTSMNKSVSKSPQKTNTSSVKQLKDILTNKEIQSSEQAAMVRLLRNQAYEHEQTINAMKQTITQKNTLISSLLGEKSAKDIEGIFDNDLAASEDRPKGFSYQLSKNRTLQKELAAQIESYEKKLLEMRRRESQHTKSTSVLVQRVRDLQARNKKVEAKAQLLASKPKKNNGLKKKLTESKARIRTKTERNAVLANENRALKRQMADLKTENETLTARCALLTHSYNQLTLLVKQALPEM